jgi:hypothetical protein
LNSNAKSGDNVSRHSTHLGNPGSNTGGRVAATHDQLDDFRGGLTLLPGVCLIPRTDVDAQTGATDLFSSGTGHSGLQPKRPVDWMRHPPPKP